jgi:hypothetical protein
MPSTKYFTVLGAAADAVNTEVTAASAGTVYSRGRPKVLESDSIPCVVLSPSTNDGTQIIQESFGGEIVYGYPVTCLVVSKGNTILTNSVAVGGSTAADTDLQNHMALMEIVRGAVWKRTLSGATTVFNSEIEVAPAVAIAGASGGLYLVTAVKVTYWSLESQTW